jgi:hypothetical protein
MGYKCSYDESLKEDTHREFWCGNTFDSDRAEMREY